MMLLISIFAAAPHAFDSLRSSLPSVLPALAQSAGTTLGAATLAAATLVTAIWQAAVVVIGVACALKIVRRTTAALRFSIWVAGFAAALCMPVWSILWSVLAKHSTLPMAPTAELPSSPWIQVDIRWSLALAALWAAASLYRAVDLAVHAVRLRALWKDAKPVPAEKLALLANHVGNARLRRRIEICTSLKQDRPGVIGFFAPRILIPAWLLDRLTPAELTHIVMHETEHIRRGDDWTNLLQKLGLVLFPLNPALFWIDHRLCTEREMACDEAVVRATGAPRAYAACLTNLAEHGRAWRNQTMERAMLTLGAWRRRSELVNRVHTILRNRGASDSRVGALYSRGMLAVLICGLTVASAELSRWPQLVAFVPAQTQQLTQAVNEGNAHGIATMARPVSLRGAGQFHISSLKAVVSRTNPSSMPSYDDIPAASVNSTWKPARVTYREDAPARRELSPAIAPERYSNIVDTAALDADANAQFEAQSPAGAAFQVAGQQGWLVLTTWEEVATTETSSAANSSSPLQTPANSPAAALQQLPEMELATSEPSAASSIPQANPEGIHEIRVTRVIFRVVPASFVSPAPHLARTRDGWLVLQL